MFESEKNWILEQINPLSESVIRSLSKLEQANTMQKGHSNSTAITIEETAQKTVN